MVEKGRQVESLLLESGAPWPRVGVSGSDSSFSQSPNKYIFSDSCMPILVLGHGETVENTSLVGGMDNKHNPCRKIKL